MAVLLLAILTGIAVVGVTILADKFGHRIGGLIATAPVTATIGVIFVIKTSNADLVRDVVLAGNFSVIASLFAVLAYFYTVKFGRRCSNTTKVVAGEFVFFIVYIGLIFFLRRCLPVGWYLFAVDIVLVLIFIFTFMRAKIELLRDTVVVKKTLRELMVRFAGGFAAFLVIKFFSGFETVISGAIAVFPGIFAVSIGIMGIRQSAEFSAKAAQSGIFGVTAIAFFVLGYGLWIPFLSSRNDIMILCATLTALALYFSSLYIFGRATTRPQQRIEVGGN